MGGCHNSNLVVNSLQFIPTYFRDNSRTPVGQIALQIHYDYQDDVKKLSVLAKVLEDQGYLLFSKVVFFFLFVI